VLFLVEAVRQRGSRGLVDEAQDLEASHAAGVLGRLPLAVVEVGGHSDDSLGDLLTQVRLGGLLQLSQNHGRDLRRGILLAPHFYPGVALCGPDGLERAELDLLEDLVTAATPPPPSA